MVQFTFDAMFRTTNKGLPDTANIDPYTYLSMNHFVYSLIVEIIIGLVLTGYTGMAVYRAFYKIKNQKFFPGQTSTDELEEKDEAKSKSEGEDEKDENTNDNLIYRFDEDEKKEKEDGKEEEEEEENEENQAEEETVSEQTTDWFLDLDHKLLYFQTFLIPFAVVVNIFSVNVLVIILLGVALVLFFLFNIKQLCSKTAVTQLFFTIPCIAVFLMVYFEDRDMST